MMTIGRGQIGIVGTALTTLLSASPAHAGGIPDYDFEWATIGDPGNRNSLPEEGNPLLADNHEPSGAVDHVYRISRTEVTLGQYVEFVEAYYPLDIERTGRILANPDFTGNDILTGLDGVRIRPGVSPNRAAEMSWEYAARYVNWLHNGKVNEAWAFDSGVYDASTFTQNPDGTYNHQLYHDAGAKFWIPTSDEWIKAAYWDSKKNDGEGGYWLYPNGSDVESVPQLLPQEGGERNAGDRDDGFPLDVMSFPDVQSPWGLFDLAGGVSEWTETVTLAMRPHQRFSRGSRWAEDSYLDPFFPHDIIGDGDGNNVWGLHTGLRLAAAIPAPNTFTIAGCVFCYISRRKR